MKKILLAALLLVSISMFATTRHRIVKGTNSVSIDGVKYPLNAIVMKIYPDSVRVQFYNMYTYNQGNQAQPLTVTDSIVAFTYNGTTITTAFKMDSLYQVAFVK